MKDQKTVTTGERELDSALVWWFSLSLAMKSAKSQRVTATADCGQDKVRLARTTIELDHFNGECWTGSQERKKFQDMCSQHTLACLSVKNKVLTQLC